MDPAEIDKRVAEIKAKRGRGRPPSINTEVDVPGHEKPVLELRKILAGIGPLVAVRTNKITKEERVVVIDESRYSWATFGVYSVKNPKADTLACNEQIATLLHRQVQTMLDSRTTEKRWVERKDRNDQPYLKGIDYVLSNGKLVIGHVTYQQIDKKAYPRRIRATHE